MVCLFDFSLLLTTSYTHTHYHHRYAEEGNPKLFAIQLSDQTQDFYECRTKDECAEIWQCLKESLRPYKTRHHHTVSQDGVPMNLGDDNKDESQDDLFTKLHSISKEDWVDMGYLGMFIRVYSSVFERGVRE